MKFESLLTLVGREPVFYSSLLTDRFIAHRMKPLSYVSLHSALAFHGIAKEPQEVQCVTIRKPELVSNQKEIILRLQQH